MPSRRTQTARPAGGRGLLEWTHTLRILMTQFTPPQHGSTAHPRGRSIILWAAALLGTAVVFLRVALARPLSFCGTPDACFYLGMAQNLASGRGFQARFLYDFQQAHPALPNTGLEYWRPGISLILLLLKPLGGVTLHSSIVLTTVVGVALAGAAWHIAMRAFGDRRIALGSFAFCLLSSPAWVGSASPDSGLYYGAAVAWFLALFTVRRQGLAQDLLALFCAGLAYLIRNDAAMLLVPLVAVLWARRRKASESASPEVQRGSSLAYALLILAGFLAALVPMHLLYHAVLGTAFPSGTAQTLYLNDLSDFGRYKDPVSLRGLLHHGVKHLLLFRVGTFATLIYRVAVLMVGYPALVFLPALSSRKSASLPRSQDAGGSGLPELLGPASFAVVTLLVYTLVLPAIGGFSALRTAVGLMPLASVLVVLAITRATRTPRLAAWITAGVIAANALAGIMEERRDLPVANGMGTADREAAEVLAELSARKETAVVLTNDPVQFSVMTGYATVALPSNGLDAIADAAHDFHATHVILGDEDLPAAAALTQRLHPVRSATLSKEHTLILELPQTTPGS